MPYSFNKWSLHSERTDIYFVFGPLTNEDHCNRLVPHKRLPVKKTSKAGNPAPEIQIHFSVVGGQVNLKIKVTCLNQG